MRAVVVALSALALTGCGGSDDEAGRLDELGFFRYAPSAQARQAAISEVRDDAEAGVFTDRTRRFYFADGEDLAEGGVGAFLRELQPVLREMRVRRLRIRETVEDANGDYTIQVNGHRYLVLDHDDPRFELFWGIASHAAVNIVNDLLVAARSPERAWGVNHPASNDFAVFLLTKPQRDELARILGEEDAPFEVENYPPRFGYGGEGFGAGEPGGVR